MAEPILLRLDETGDGRLAVAGDWTLANYGELRSLVSGFTAAAGVRTLDCTQLRSIDTAGASLLAQLLGADPLRRMAREATGLDAPRRALLDAVASAVATAQAAPRPRPRGALYELLERIGAAVLAMGRQVYGLLGFIGLVLESLVRSSVQPRRWRITAVVAQLEQIALNATPIVALLTFMVGAVVAFLGATVLNNFGASIYTIDLVGYSFLREFGVLLAAILLAGRTSSAFAAQLGSMKVNEELDAIRALGLDEVELLVLPRVLAMVLALPLLTVIAMGSGLVGGMLVCLLKFDIPPAMFLSRLHADIALQHFWVGISKAPVFAFLIACIGCIQGFAVGNSAQSVGQHTTSSVVQSIFVVIVLDALAALFFMEMNW